MTKPLFEAGADWTFDLIRDVDEACAEIAFEELGLDIYKNQIEIIGSDQMLEAYSSVGLPIMYDHWSFGKRYMQDEFSYRKGMSGLAYEIVINSDPCISYCMEENSMTMQALVIAHAAYGHNHFFKNNYLFKEWTQADAIVDYLVFAKKFISKCEEEYGPGPVQDILDAAHSLQQYGVDRYRRPAKLNKEMEQERQKERAEYLQQQVNLLWSTLPEPTTKRKADTVEDRRFKKIPPEPQENILYFLEKHSPVLESWEREIIRIVRKLAQYFYPQRQTKLMNEGFASFTHYYIMNRLFEKGLITEGSMLEFLHSHSSVLTQRPYNSQYYSGYNPYALGFDMFMDIKRMCENPTDEDRDYVGHVAGQDWRETILDAVANYRDESFVSQFLSPRIVKKWQMFKVDDMEGSDRHNVIAIQNKSHFHEIRQSLAKQYSIWNQMPNIEVINGNVNSTRTLVLRHTPKNGERLESKTKEETLAYCEFLWGYPVEFEKTEDDAKADISDFEHADIAYYMKAK
jgi:stage V sporulation protein R